MGFTVYQMDVKSAFIYDTIEEEVYVHQPPGFVDPAYPNKVYKVIKALYGLHQASKAWYETLSSFLMENGFRRGTIDKTLFVKKKKSDIMLVQVYVDDIIFGSTKKSMCTEFEECACYGDQGESHQHNQLNPSTPVDHYTIHQPTTTSITTSFTTSITTTFTPPYSPPHSLPPRSYEAPLPEGNTSRSAEASIQLKELMVLVPSLVTRVTSLEKELKDTKQTLGNAVLRLVKKVKSLEKALKRKSKKVIVSASEGEEPEDQGRIIQDIDDDPLVSLVRESMKEKSTDFVTPIKASGEAQEEEEISPTILEAAKTLSKVASQSVSKAKSTDKGKRYRRRARSMAKKINTELDAEDEINTGRVEINSGIEDVNTGSSKVDTSRTSISTSSIIHSPKKGQREGKAQMVEEDIQATHKTKEQIRQEEAGLEEAIRLQAQMDEEDEVQKAAQFYTEEDWDTIRAKLEANTEVVKSLQGEIISNDDFAKRMVEMINEKKKFYAEQKAKAKRSKPMTQAQQREYMSTFIKNQSSWKLSQLKKLSFEELKTEFKKLMKSIESFVPMETKARVKRHGLQLEQETSKKQKIDIEDASITKGKDEVVKEEETKVPVKKIGMRRKQKARKGINIDKTAQDEFNKEREAYVKDKVKDASSKSKIGVDVIPTAIKPPTIVNWKIISQSSQKAAYQIIRKHGSDKIYMSFRAILKDFSRDELVELYRLVINKYGENTPEEMYDIVLWGDLKTMFDPPLSDDAIWSLPLQQKIINWRYYPTCDVHYLTLDASSIYMLADRKYPFVKRMHAK
ncbi:putative ribonuclease H-like domain-containing protein [Tanacetum coccineum]|uniref:Ribonuclease H-like domain-containing protein n=1 Tax=Tanacetum coccineum TaxID=301880 RepID=A0ABQ5GTE1_9ASTR